MNKISCFSILIDLQFVIYNTLRLRTIIKKFAQILSMLFNLKWAGGPNKERYNKVKGHLVFKVKSDCC